MVGEVFAQGGPVDVAGGDHAFVGEGGDFVGQGDGNLEADDL